MSILTKILLTFIKVYQKGISPFVPARCRYYPTCSNYGQTAIKWHGARRGGYLTLKRLSRCHPLGGSGVDFVPVPLYRYQFSCIDSNFERWQIPYCDHSSYKTILNQLLSTP